MFAADYPFEKAEEAGHWMDNVKLDETVRADIAFNNAVRLLRLESRVTGLPMTKLLVLDRDAEFYAEQLRREYPDLGVLPALNLERAAGGPSHIDVLISFGVTINDEVISRLRGLKWIQSLATGVDHFLRCPSLDATC